MTTVTYAFETLGSSPTVLIPKGYTTSVVASGSGFLLAATVAESFLAAQVYGRVFDAHAAPRTSAFLISKDAGAVNSVADTAALADGTLVTTSQSNANTGSIFASLNSPSGTAVKSNFEVSPGAPGPQSDPSVAALSDGGFVVTFTYKAGDTDHDVFAQRYDLHGNTLGAVLTVDDAGSLDTAQSSVAGLAGGGFAVVYSQKPSAGGNEHMELRVFNKLGVGGAATETDASGLFNEHPDILGLKDGGFALAYENNGWSGAAADSDITLQIFNADGTPRTNHLRVNASDLLTDDANTVGSQSSPTLAQLANGSIVVGWSSSSATTYVDIKARAFDPKGHALTAVSTFANTPDYEDFASLAGLKGGGLAAAWLRQTDAGYQTMGVVTQLVRTSVGTKHDEKIKGDALVDHMSGRGGSDKLLGGKGADILKGGRGADDLYAGRGDDRDVFVFGKHDSSAAHPDKIHQFDAHAKNEAVWDRIDLSGIDADKHAKHDQQFRFVDQFEKPGKHGAEGEVTVHEAGKNVKVLIDKDGDKDADLVILVMHIDALHKADFIL